MACGPLCRTKEKKSYPETAESGTFWISTLIDMDSRLRVARGIGKDETEASLKVFQTLKQRGHPDGPPPLISDGWGGIDEAMLAVYGLVPERTGQRGRPPSHPKTWQRLAVSANGQATRRTWAIARGEIESYLGQKN